MMRALRNEHNVKTVSFIVAVVFVLGIAAYALMGSGNIAQAAPTSSIGVVDQSMIIEQTATLGQQFQEQMAAAASELQKEFDEKSVNMSEAEKQQYFQSMQEKFSAKQAEIQKNIQGKIDNAVKQVAEKKSLNLVVDKNAVLYGGVDITSEVQTALNAALEKEAAANK
ncbi:MAG: OmpH family outer membrane protein [Veillonellaceae bacterium]|nr:OmpH family outer membrane protein [Veillonellaceae bacterium]